MQYFSSATTLGAPSKSVEIKIPLAWMDGVGVNMGAWTTAGSAWFGDGSGQNTSSSNSSIKLHTLNTKWLSSQIFAFEVTGYSNNASYPVNFALWDFSLGTPAIVSGSQVTTSSTTATVIRSGTTTLTPGHIYGVTSWSANGTPYLVDASLIVFP